MSNFIKSYQANVGLNHTPAYQVSGQPYAEGSIDASSATQTVNFPYVTRWVVVSNTDASDDLKVGFSSNGVEGTNYFIVHPNTTSPRLEVKVSQLFLNGGGSDSSVVAGLTSIPTSRVDTSTGTNWSGSSGVG